MQTAESDYRSAYEVIADENDTPKNVGASSDDVIHQMPPLRGGHVPFRVASTDITREFAGAARGMLICQVFSSHHHLN
jgi:hypothetical protein